MALDVFLAVSTAAAVFGIAQWVSLSFFPQATATALAALSALAVATGLLGRWKTRWSLVAAARLIETLRPPCRNLVITAEELQRHPARTSARMLQTVEAQASRMVDGLTSAQVAPGRRASSAASAALILSAGVLLAPPAREMARTVATVATSTAERIRGVRATRVVIAIRPPAYTRLGDRTVTDPSRVDVLEGSRLSFTLTGDGSRRLRFGNTTLGELAAGNPSIEHAARDSGYFAVESGDGASPLFVVLSVTPDRAPIVRIDQPARDLLVPDALRTVPVTLSASDDLALASLELRYTRVSGAGEQFEFVEGELPVHMERASAREWRGSAVIGLANLHLGPGDSIVYHAVARDARGATGLGASDTFFIEIAGPGQVALDAVGMPPEEDRYALSQQMIVLKIERLRSRERDSSRQQTVDEAAMIAAEQRSVRANFVFRLGGHVEDEEVEAEQSSEIAEGRLINSARRDINAAVGDMTRAEQGLVAVELSAAHAAARAAVKSLQRAFGRNRYFLRTPPARSRIDPSRRLTGQMDAITGWNRRPTDPPADEGSAARGLLTDLLDLSNAIAARSVVTPLAVERLAERALSLDAASPTWQGVSRRLLEVRATLKRPAEAQAMLHELAAIVRRESDRGLLPRTALSTPASPLFRAWEARSPR